MPDWKAIVRDRIALLHLEGPAESDLIEELTQHLEDRYRECISGGADEQEAYLKAISELDDMYPLQTESKRTRQLPSYDAVPPGDARPDNA